MLGPCACEAPYLTIRPRDGNLTGGGLLKLAPRMVSDALLAARASAGEDRFLVVVEEGQGGDGARVGLRFGFLRWH